METDECNMPGTLPDTQNADSQCMTQSQDTLVPSQSENLVWGRLCPHDSTLQTVVLQEEEYFFGRHPKCNIPVKEDMLVDKKKFISKHHFRIHREKSTSSNGVEDHVIYLEDLAQNGTYVNNVLVGKNRKVVLVNNDLIAVAKVHYKIFVFMSTSGYDDSFLPDQLKMKYAVSRTLGAGACGEVKLCFSKIGPAGKKCAMKIISKTKIGASGHKNPFNDEKHIMNEVSICKRLQHPCVIKVEEFFESPTMVYIILELMEGGELFERIKKEDGLTENNAKFIFYQVILAVNYLHDNGITHRDLKPENILLAGHEDETIVKVSDFGLSKFVDSQTMMKTFCGTPMYVAPEILQTNGRGSYDSQVDVWSLGVILYCCLSGLTPFKVHDKTNTLYEQIIKGIYHFNVSKFFNVSSNAKDLIRKMMTVDPKKRITIKKVLEHPWLRDEEMLKKVNNLLGKTTDENSLPRRSDQNSLVRRPMNDNIPMNPVKHKRARLE